MTSTTSSTTTAIMGRRGNQSVGGKKRERERARWYEEGANCGVKESHAFSEERKNDENVFDKCGIGVLIFYKTTFALLLHADMKVLF